MIIQKEDAADLLRQKDISPSYPRKRILEYLIEKHNHPTVAKLYSELIVEIPSLSKTTVYNTLKIFMEKRIVEEIIIEGNEKRYDLYDHQGHAHFRCESCENLFDISLDLSGIISNDLRNFEVKSKSVHISGLCSSCTGR